MRVTLKMTDLITKEVFKSLKALPKTFLKPIVAVVFIFCLSRLL